jgi:hypothetical protein
MQKGVVCATNMSSADGTSWGLIQRPGESSIRFEESELVGTTFSLVSGKKVEFDYNGATGKAEKVRLIADQAAPIG